MDEPSTYVVDKFTYFLTNLPICIGRTKVKPDCNSGLQSLFDSEFFLKIEAGVSLNLIFFFFF